MAIDIRSTVTCSLGTLISGSISDDYLQGSGLVKTKGSVEINGTITPAIGTVVTFSYVKGGVTRAIPRKLRVMSSFADPFRRTTQVELGCKLTYLSDLKDRLDWTAFDDPENAALTEADAEIITIPIRASSIMAKCLAELGIAASGNPLTNQFSIPEFDFSAGYVQILSDLLVSESYFGYLDTSEVLQVRNLAVDAGTGPVITASDIVDLGPIGVGQLPGEAVTVNYSTLKLKDGPVEDPDENEIALEGGGSANWNVSKTFNASTVAVGYKNPVTGEPATQLYNILDSTEEQTTYGIAGRDGDNVVIQRTFLERTGDVNVAGSMVTAYLSNGIPWSLSTVLSNTIETFKYDSDGNEIQRVRTRYADALFGYGSVGLPMVFSPTDYVPKPSGQIILDRTVTDILIAGPYRKTITSTYGTWIQTINGQQSVAEARDAYTTASQVKAYLDTALSSLYLLNVSVSVEKSEAQKQEAPTDADITNANNADDTADPANNYRVESSAELELALGSSTAQRRIELSMPYAPDDRFIKTGSSPATYSSVPSDAPQKAARYGRTQNRLLLGNRNGINLQLSPERLPAAPFEPLYVQANGLTALYRANGNQWAFDSNGIVCSTDALFWAAVGGTGTFWFPVAPGISTLPTTPAVVDGEMNATTVVLPYNETAVYDSRLRLGNVVTKFGYALELLTTVPALRLRTQVDVRRILKVETPAANIALSAVTPKVSGGSSAKPAAINTQMQVMLPSISSGYSTVVPSVDLSTSGYAPVYVGTTATVIQPPAAEFNIAANDVQVASGASISPAAYDLALSPLVPIASCGIAPTVAEVGGFNAADGSLVVDWPPHLINDIGLLVIETSGADTTLTPPSGWSALTGSPVTDVASTAGSKLQVWWSRAAENQSAFDPAISVTVGDAGDHQVARILAIRGCPTSGDPWDATTTGTKSPGSTTATVPEVTTTLSNTLVVYVAANPVDSGSTTRYGTPSNAVLANLQDHGEAATSLGNGGGFVVVSGTMIGTGATGNTTMTLSTSSTNTYMTIAFKRAT